MNVFIYVFIYLHIFVCVPVRAPVSIYIYILYTCMKAVLHAKATHSAVQGKFARGGSC